MAVFDTEERRIMGPGLMLIVWMFGQLCDMRWSGGRPWGFRRQGAWLIPWRTVSTGLAPAFVGLALMSGGRSPSEGGMAGVVGRGAAAGVAAAAWRLALCRRVGEASSHPSVEWISAFPHPWLRSVRRDCWPSGPSFPLKAQESLAVVGVVGGVLLPLWMVSRLPQMGVKTWGRDRPWTGVGWPGCASPVRVSI